MHNGYEPYCLANSHFYDAPTRTRGDDRDFEAASWDLPDGWKRTELDEWLVSAPANCVVPAQGWKVHVSACLDNAEALLAQVFEYCVSRGLPFKFIRSRQLLLLRNGKYADRGSSGKFITIFPRDESQLESVLVELGSALNGQAGPYVLSDLRWGSGPLYVRYGGFAERYCLGPAGDLVLAIADEAGSLVPDNRAPTFGPPDWVALPEFLLPHLEARHAATVEGLPYTIESALHFSNGGGIYRGTDGRTGEEVVLKEARPHAGLDTDGVDAVCRLRREARVLERLRGLDVVPVLRDQFVLDEHFFVVEGFVEGTPLNDLIVERYPLIAHELDAEAVMAYAEWAVTVHRRVESAVEEIHRRGVVIGDLHPSNMLVKADGQVVLIDFEVASTEDEARRPTLADPAFLAPATCHGFDIDRYALACLRLYLFLPLTNLLIIEPAKAVELAAEILRLFPVAPEFVGEAVALIVRDAAPAPEEPSFERRLRPAPAELPSWHVERDLMTRAILASATPERNDRLFPGDVKQFVTGGLNFAFGAAGVLYALAVTGFAPLDEQVEWLASRALRPDPGTRLGFYDGLHGVAYALDYLGRTREAAAVLDTCQRELDGQWDRLGLDLYGGLSGIALNLWHFAYKLAEPSLEDQAARLTDVVAARLGSEDSVAELSGGEHPHAGLFRGSSGPALLFMHRYKETGDTAYLDFARTALGQDLRRCYLRDDGSLEVNEGWRTMPYLADGSAGIGMVLDDYLKHRDDTRLRARADAIRRASDAQFYIEPGLFYGRAGMILARSRDFTPGTGGDDPVIASHLRNLAWHALPYEGGIAFPGEQLLRLSMDLATGTSGVLLAMGAALHHEPVHLPFLESSNRVLNDLATTKGGESRWQYSTCKV